MNNTFTAAAFLLAVIGFLVLAMLFAVRLFQGAEAPTSAAPVPAEHIVQEPERFTAKWKVNSLGVPFCVVHDRVTGKTSTFVPKEEKQHER